MYNELNNHKKSDNVKWIAAFVCIAILFVGVIAALIPTYTVRDEADPDVTINDTEMAGGAVIAYIIAEGFIDAKGGKSNEGK